MEDETNINSSGNEIDPDNIESFDEYVELYGLDKEDGEKELEFWYKEIIQYGLSKLP